jgi:hypothetical protein
MPVHESTVLARELGKIGGFGANLVARILPTVYYESSLEMQGEPQEIARLVEQLASRLGREIPEMPSHPEQGRYTFVIGGGVRGLNPTVVHVGIKPSGSLTSVSVRAAAKEGLLKQKTAEGVVVRFQTLLVRHDA